VALHRAPYLARGNPQARVLLTTFSEPLANVLRAKLRLLLTGEPRLGERIEVYSMDAIGRRLYELNIGKLRIATDAQITGLLQQGSTKVGGHKFSLRFLETEWGQVVDGWQLDTWEEYRDVNRLGRKTRLKEEQRKLLWSIFEAVRSGLREQGLITTSGMFNILARHYANGAALPFDFAVVDEAQDIGVAQIRFLAAFGSGRPNGLFFAGDLGQRIFQQPFSWKAAGIDVRGRSTTLKINYRTSHQIRSQADRLLDPQITDVDGNIEARKGTISLFNGPQPDIKVYKSTTDEIGAVGDWLTNLIETGLQPHEIALFVRSTAQLDRPKLSAEKAGVKSKVLDEHVETTPGSVSVSTMHLAKGLEFRAVGVMACDDEVIPLQERIQTVADEGDLEDVYNTERQLLYVACTRARDHLLVTSTAPESEFLDDLMRSSETPA
jgi:superfamily I DNA/RNA helicase